jgi:hypothetical protein
MFNDEGELVEYDLDAAPKVESRSTGYPYLSDAMG